MESVLSHGRYKGISTTELQRYLHPNSLQDVAITNLVHEMSAANTSEMYLNQMHATLHREPVREKLKTAKFPILIVGGLEDRVVSKEELELLHADVPKAEFALLTPCGHYVPLEKAGEFNILAQKILVLFRKEIRAI